MAALHSRCYIIITIYGNDAVNYYMHLQMFVAYAHATKNKVYLTHDESSQLQFDLIQAQTMAHLPAFAMFFGCLLKIPISHFQLNILPESSQQYMNIDRFSPLLWHKYAITK